jgi:hypothetical protein
MKLVRTISEFNKWCSEHNYTRSEIATILRVSRQTIHNWTSTKLTRELSRNTRKRKNDLDKRTPEFVQIPMRLSLCLVALETLGKGFFVSQSENKGKGERGAD